MTVSELLTRLLTGVPATAEQQDRLRRRRARLLRELADIDAVLEPRGWGRESAEEL